jgi:two-component system sensor histidine kinase DesK
VFAVGWLVFMIDPVKLALSRHTPRDDAGAVVLVVFSIAYLVAADAMRSALRVDPRLEEHGRRLLRRALAVMVVLALTAMALAGTPGIGTLPYLAVVGSLAFGRFGGVWVAALAAGSLLLAWVHRIPWDEAQGVATGTLSAGLSVWIYALLSQRQRAQLRASEAEGALALETQRGRFARDLHDIVGHSLSTVTIKAGLARRLLDVDPDRARAELEDLERLAREALDDVRRAVGGYRDLSLPGELAKAREVLASAGIEAEVPTTADDVDPRLRELFAWTVREGVTNVVRHSRARTCRITLERRQVVVEDDGRGTADPAADQPAASAADRRVGGHGLVGLGERAAPVGAVVVSEALHPRGFRLTVRAQGASA